MTQEQKSFLKNMIAGLIITVLVCLLDGSREYPLTQCLCDGFFVAAVMLAGIGGIKFVINKGVFDVAAYGLKSMLHIHFPGTAVGEEKEDFLTYQQNKQTSRKPANGLLWAGLIYFVMSIVMLLLYYLL